MTQGITVATSFVGSVGAVVRSVAPTSTVDADAVGQALQLPVIAPDYKRTKLYYVGGENRTCDHQMFATQSTHWAGIPSSS